MVSSLAFRIAWKAYKNEYLGLTPQVTGLRVLWASEFFKNPQEILFGINVENQ